MAALSTDLSEWAAHRRAVVFAVSRRVPGVDPEVAAGQGLEALCRAIVAHGAVDEPVAYWTDAAVDAALALAGQATVRQARRVQAPLPALMGGAAGRARGAASGAARHAAPSAGSRAGQPDPRIPAATEHAQRALDLERLHTAMEKLPTQEQQLLWDRHVRGTPVEQIAGQIGVLPYAARRRLRRAENRLASGFAEVHAAVAEDEVCRATRAAMHDYIRHRLMPRRQRRFEDHMLGCAGCTRAFVDVRESYWMLRAAAPVLLLGTLGAGKASALVAAGTGGAVAGATAAHVGAAGTASTASTAAGLGQKTAVLVRSLLTDPVSLTAAVVGGLIATSGATGVAYQATALPALQPAVVTTEPPTPAEPVGPVTPGAATPADPVSAQGAAPGVEPDAAASVNPAAVDEAEAPVGASLEAGLETGLVDVGTGVSLTLDAGAVEAQVTVAAGGALLAAAYKIVPLSDQIAISAVSVDEDLAIITRLGEDFYVIPLTDVLPIDLQATVTVLSPEGVSVDLAASVDLTPASPEEEGALTTLLTALLGDVDDGSGGTGLLGGLGDLIGDTVDGLTSTLTGTTSTLTELADALQGTV